uniref:Chromo domain-containing protein n=1 Tax=Gongylonema pulchrum TaxID=637853 RepID=A0A183EUW9_9BILA
LQIITTGAEQILGGQFYNEPARPGLGPLVPKQIFEAVLVTLSAPVGKAGPSQVSGNDARKAASTLVGDAKPKMAKREDVGVFEVESILDSKVTGGQRFYHVKWKNYPVLVLEISYHSQPQAKFL